MKYEFKQRLLNYLENGGSEEERKSLIKMMKETEMGYADLDCMSVCTDDEGCADLTHEQLETVAEKLQDRLMEEFNCQLGMVLDELGYNK